MVYSMKLSKLYAHLNAAEGYAKLSKAKRLKVGAVLVRDDRIISLGYNGNPSGYSNTCEEEVNGELRTRKSVCHAEVNVISFAARHGIATQDTTLITTDSPCYECAKVLIQAGVKSIYYAKAYRDVTPLTFLEDNGVLTAQIGDAAV